MTLLRRNKVRFEQQGIDRKLYAEVYDELAVDDIVAFMAQSEAERRYFLLPRGDSRDPQTPSDELKAYLMDFSN